MENIKKPKVKGKMPANLPYIKVYVGDELRSGLSGCSLAAQGLWLRMRFLMHDSKRYGYLISNGMPIPPETAAQRCGCSVEQYMTLLNELFAAEVPGRTPEGIIFCSQMVRDEAERTKNKKRLDRFRSKGGKNNETDLKRLCNDDETDLKRTYSYSYSVSSSNSENELTNYQPPPDPRPENQPVDDKPDSMGDSLQETWEAMEAVNPLDPQFPNTSRRDHDRPPDGAADISQEAADIANDLKGKNSRLEPRLTIQAIQDALNAMGRNGFDECLQRYFSVTGTISAKGLVGWLERFTGMALAEQAGKDSDQRRRAEDVKRNLAILRGAKI